MREISTRLKTVMATIAIVVLLLLLWQLHTLILLIFAAIIVAIILRSMSQPLARQTGLDHRITLAICIALIVVVAAAVVTALGRLVSEELSTLSERLPAMFEQIEWIDFGAIADWIESKDWLGGKSIITSITGVSALLLSVAVNLVVVVMGAIYFAAGPRTYRTGFLKLLPPEQHEVAGETLTAVSESLRLFILGQLASMVAVGVLTTAGLLILGIPSAIALGILAGSLAGARQAVRSDGDGVRDDFLCAYFEGANSDQSTPAAADIYARDAYSAAFNDQVRVVAPLLP